MEKILTVKLNTLKDFREFMERATMLNGSARALQGETNVDAKSTQASFDITRHFSAFEFKF